MSPGLLWSDDGEVALVAAYWRLCLVDYLSGRKKAGRHYYTARKELLAVGWVDAAGRLLVAAPVRDRRREARTRTTKGQASHAKTDRLHFGVCE